MLAGYCVAMILIKRAVDCSISALVNKLVANVEMHPASTYFWLFFRNFTILNRHICPDRQVSQQLLHRQDWQDPTIYRPGAATARAVRSRDGTCRFPGCATAAKRCQLDHVIRHPDGPTSVPNLQSLCATHHGFKHHAGWRVEMDPLGVCKWTAPDGRTHTTWPLDRHGFRAA